MPVELYVSSERETERLAALKHAFERGYQAGLAGRPVGSHAYAPVGDRWVQALCQAWSTGYFIAGHVRPDDGPWSAA